MKQILSLYELNQMIKEALEVSFPQTFLVTAEIASCDIKNHCYLSLIDKQDDNISAEIKAVIWANKFKTISSRFREETGTDIKKGIKILFEAEISFHERYGLKLNILNIDPSYTVGELAVRRKEILQRLAAEGLIDKNRELEFPLVPQRIGIISSATAAGYEDLINHLEHNSYGYIFYCKLYEAAMQGDRAEASIVSALKKCLDDADALDVVVIVRGGGGSADLQCFDSYEIGKAIALLDLPVISGIGHHRDITVADEVSNRRAKTPTAVADMIITAVREFEGSIDSFAHSLVHGTGKLTSDLREELSILSNKLEVTTRNELTENAFRLVVFIKGLGYSLKVIRNEIQKLVSRESNVNHLDPKNVLKRGYSITYNNGSAVKSVSDVKDGDNIRTVLYDGELLSNVTVRRILRSSRKKKRGGNDD